jgi:MYXO-CTERM domain-containing protein
MVMVDTSGSMVWHFGDCATSNGDSGAPAVFCDNSIGTAFACNKNLACSIANGGVPLWPTTLNNPSRLYAAKAALNDVINSAAGDLDFGLERYSLTVANEYANGFNFCPNGTNCCHTQINGTTRGRCVPRFLADYPAAPNNVVCTAQFVDGNGNLLPSDCNLTTAGGCGTSVNCAGNCTNTQGGQVLISPGTGSSQQVLPWIDYVEDFCANNGVVDGPPRNPELRASGGTPLAGSVRSARINWYTPIFTTSNGGNCNPNNALCDQQINCRPYVNVVMTDGGETCENPAIAFTDPQTAVQELTNVNNVNPVKTYIIAMSFAQTEACNPSGADFIACPKTGPNGGCTNGFCSCKTNADCGETCDGFGYTCGNDNLCHHPAQASLNAMAAAGGTNTARFANNQADIEAAFADIAASSVLYEQCNGKDDNCNGFIDEGLGVYQECTTNNQCASGTCNAGRCTCANNGQCANGFVCGGGFCLPSCTVGVSTCQRTGVKKCSGMGNACCVNDGLAACTPLMPGMPGVEVCNGIDDNCNGLIDENGVCQKCTPTPETCNGKDDDCDNIVDNNLVDTGKACGLNVGICMPGTTECVNMANGDVGNGAAPDNTDHLICNGGVQPKAPQCNGCDNDCDGVRDGATQNCYSGPNGTEGVGICHGGTQTCTAMVCPQAAQFGPCVGEVDPQKEICNGIDDDCNGKIDDVMGANVACCPSGKCGVGICMAGIEQCSGGALACIGGVGPQPEVCNGVDDDCNGKVDDLPGIGNPCVPNGGCQGMLVCDVNKQMIVCQSNGMKGVEICNGLDDDCNGIIDDPNEVAMNDNRVGKPCGNPMNLPPPCQAGTTICKNGMIVCDGAVGPMMEVCDGLDNNCDGMTDEMAPCPKDFVCYNANCDPICQMGEFPCPGGYTSVMYMGQCICVADKNCMPACTNGQVCDTQTGMCVDPCAKVTCPNGEKCEGGSCYGCEKFGCGNCQRCDKASHMCVADKCCNVNCTEGQYCDPSTGMCIATCANGCPSGQICSNGNCVADPCFNKHCPENQSCDPKTGDCVSDPCVTITCGPNLACCSGQCVGDPCAAVMCPGDTVCKVSSLTCSTSCVSGPPPGPKNKDQIVGAGGGGFSCSTGGRPGSPVPSLALIAGALALLFVRRRKK